MFGREQKSQHRRNPSSNLLTGRSKRTTQDKSSSRDKTSKEKSRRSKDLQNKMMRRMSFQSPTRKDDDPCSKSFSLLNYMIFKEKTIRPPIMGAGGSQDIEKGKTKDQFIVKEVLGKGGFGRVMKVEFKKNRKKYAMKEMSKSVIITKKSIQSVLNERELLSELRHPFLVNMIYAFQDRTNLYLIMDLMPGGDLRYQIGKFQCFPEHIVKFFVCCIIVGLEYLHANNIIHRDIKPENLVIDSKGYLRITDLGVARLYSSENYKDTSGTPGYMAPEVINRQNHSFSVDIFAMGVIAYECMLGKRPYRGYNRQQIRQQMLLYEAQIKRHQIPDGWSPDAAQLINKMLKRKQEERITIEEIKKHSWFDDINWSRIEEKKYPSPFMPNIEQKNYDTVSVSEYEDQYLEKLAQNSMLLRQKQVQDLFQGYEYQQVQFL